MLFLGSVSSVSLSEKEGRLRGGEVEILGESMPAVRESEAQEGLCPRKVWLWQRADSRKLGSRGRGGKMG